MKLPCFFALYLTTKTDIWFSGSKTMRFLTARIKRSAAFTLIELIVVMAILGILLTGLIVVINPSDNIHKASDTVVQNDITQIARGAEAYSVAHSFYPATPSDLVPIEVRSVPMSPSGYSPYSYVATNASGGSCTTAASDCTKVVITGQLKSLIFVTAGTPVFRYETVSGRSCAVATATTACP